MAQVDAAPAPLATPPYRPWTQRLVEAAPVAPTWVGSGICLAHALSCLGFFALFGEPGWAPDHWPFWRQIFPPAGIMGALMGFSVAAIAYSQRAQLATLEKLRPSLDCTAAEFAELRTAVASFDRGRMRRLPLLLTLVLPPLITLNPSAFPWRLGSHVSFDSPAVIVWGLWHNGITIWLGARAGVFEQRAAQLFSEIGRRYARVDVLDLGPLAPFAHRGLQSVLMYVIGLSIFSLIFAGGWAVDLAPLGLAAMVIVAVLAMLLPLRGVHQRICRGKRLRLEALRAEIRRDEADLMDRDAPGCTAAAARLPALLALREQVESAREWPLDFANWIRFALYLAIGLGSWLGGALVERILDLFLD